MKLKHENIDMKAQKMMKGLVEPFVMPTMVRVMSTVVHVAR